MRPSLFIAAVLLAGCHSYPATPEDALSQIEQTVTSADPLAAWKLVDADTKSAVSAVLASERLMQTIVKAKYPPADAQLELEHLAAADQPDDEHFFAAMTTRWAALEGYRKRLGSISGPVKTKPDGDKMMYVARQDGMPFHLLKTSRGWAWIDPRTEWLLEKDRAAHALKTVQDNAALYKKSETP
ncbi:MAG: hypothetical protein ABI321_01895 [Polyangia bacterium]